MNEDKNKIDRACEIIKEIFWFIVAFILIGLFFGLG
jgi:hypothetical protein